ncbi:Protein of unknown function [Propionibacterium freudenreichii]|nr:Protein of unknown function [Propionibacterium freudenreichii]
MESDAHVLDAGICRRQRLRESRQDGISPFRDRIHGTTLDPTTRIGDVLGEATGMFGVVLHVDALLGMATATEFALEAGCLRIHVEEPPDLIELFGGVGLHYSSDDFMAVDERILPGP